ncbi:PREDICTED: transcription factor AIG1-like [Camelina sativa]|uniref:Transcription factor AIG1-like n=1 Tax=Camelina sativa TaxID=90675 RepID=A0ABM0YKL6_CAMSA|nr:PREDICTED: transcription factor AIG1-like [Camelina sativa]
MYAMKEEDCLQTFHNLQDYQDQFLLHHHPQILPWSSSSLPSFDPNHFPSNPTRYSDPVHCFSRRASASSSSFDYNDSFVSPPPSMEHHQNHLRILSEALGPIMRRGSSFGFDGEIMGKLSAQEVMDAKALAASKSHSEAERRRRERINTHLAKLRSILPNTTKTDKASLLAEVIQHMKELKRQTSLITDTCQVPTESDDLTVDSAYNDEDGNLVIRASFCCQDRTDLMHDVINALKSLRLRTLKAEIATVGGRVKNVLFLSREDDEEDHDSYRRNFDGDDMEGYDAERMMNDRVSSIEEALKAVIEKCVHNNDESNDNNNLEKSSSGSIKRQRTSKMVNRCYN